MIENTGVAASFGPQPGSAANPGEKFSRSGATAPGSPLSWTPMTRKSPGSQLLACWRGPPELVIWPVTYAVAPTTARQVAGPAAKVPSGQSMEDPPLMAAAVWMALKCVVGTPNG